MGVYLLLLNYNSTTLKTKVKNYFSEFNPTITIEMIPYKIIAIVTYTPMPTMLLPPLNFLMLMYHITIPIANIKCPYMIDYHLILDQFLIVH